MIGKASAGTAEKFHLPEKEKTQCCRWGGDIFK